MTHKELCDRALRWLHGSRRCEPVFAGIASCSEIPDAIGWSSCYRWTGSTVIECKTSLSDFYADKRKYFRWKHPNATSGYPYGRLLKKEAEEQGYRLEELSRMGNYRFIMCEAGLIPESAMAFHANEHGLLYCTGNRVITVVPAPRRTQLLTDLDSEIRYLRFAIINSKTPYGREFKSLQQIKSELATITSASL